MLANFFHVFHVTDDILGIHNKDRAAHDAQKGLASATAAYSLEEMEIMLEQENSNCDALYTTGQEDAGTVVTPWTRSTGWIPCPIGLLPLHSGTDVVL